MTAWNAPPEFRLRLDERHGEDCVCLALIALVGGRRDTLDLSLLSPRAAEALAAHLRSRRGRLPDRPGVQGERALARFRQDGPVKAILMRNG